MARTGTETIAPPISAARLVSATANMNVETKSQRAPGDVRLAVALVALGVVPVMSALTVFDPTDPDLVRRHSDALVAIFLTPTK